MTDLCKLATKYGTDKIYYTPFYSLLLEGRRHNVNRVLEIGIGTSEAMVHVLGYKPGASLRMWEEYFPFAQIHGFDIDPLVLFNEGRIHTFLQDSRLVDHRTMLGPYDLIVDDGSHDAVDQMATLKTCIRKLTDRGIYIIEDADPALLLMLGGQYRYIYAQVRGDLTGHCVVISG